MTADWLTGPVFNVDKDFITLRNVILTQNV